jgi:DMSO/TMAO reductase YedYZ molybdopterin-dependent catalytic subunit
MGVVDEQRGTPVGRRVVLTGLGLGILGIATGSSVSKWLSRLGAPPLLTGAGWRYYTVTSGFPYRSPADYRLRVTGEVAQPLTLTYDELRALPRSSLTRDFQCVTGWRVPDVRWEGVRLSALLDSARVRGSGTAVQFVSFDGTYTESLTLAQARRDDVLVVDTLDGQPIGREHGGPVRLLVAPMYGYKSCKWLSEIRITTALRPGYWEGYGYDQDAWVGRSNGRSDAPT